MMPVPGGSQARLSAPLRPAARALLAVALAAGVALAFAACRREPEPAQYPPQGTGTATGYGGYGGYGQYPPPTGTTTAPPPPSTSPTSPPAPTPTTTGTAPPPGPAPVAGFPCYYDTDLQCPFARCISGRCGGCRSDADCKPGATCGTSPLGAACIPSAGTGAPPPSTPPTPTATTPPTTQPPSDPFAAARARCLQRINEYRAKAKSGPVSARADREACADSQAQSDAAKNTAHGSFGKCGETAQNECPGWKGNVDTVLDSCLAAMFAEGPGTGAAHGHYNNMVEPSYKGAACGFYVAPDGGVWIVQDFYR